MLRKLKKKKKISGHKKPAILFQEVNNGKKKTNTQSTKMEKFN